MLREIKSCPKKFRSSRQPLRSFTTQTRRCLRLLLSLLTRESTKDSMSRTAEANSKILQAAASLTKDWSQVIATRKKRRPLTSTWLRPQRRRAAFCQLTSMWPRTSQPSQSWTYSSSPTLYVTSITIGLVLSRSLHLVSMLTRSQISTWRSELPTGGISSVSKKRPRHKRGQSRTEFQTKLNLWTRSSTSCESLISPVINEFEEWERYTSKLINDHWNIF